MSTVRDKRPATSPLSEGTVEKRQLAQHAQEESFSYDSEVTIMNSDFLSSTLLDTSVTKSNGGVAPGSLKEELRSVLKILLIGTYQTVLLVNAVSPDITLCG